MGVWHVVYQVSQWAVVVVACTLLVVWLAVHRRDTQLISNSLSTWQNLRQPQL